MRLFSSGSVAAALPPPPHPHPHNCPLRPTTTRLRCFVHCRRSPCHRHHRLIRAKTPVRRDTYLSVVESPSPRPSMARSKSVPTTVSPELPASTAEHPLQQPVNFSAWCRPAWRPFHLAAPAAPMRARRIDRMRAVTPGRRRAPRERGGFGALQRFKLTGEKASHTEKIIVF